MKEKVRRLAQYIHEELEKDHWGDIDPYLFKEVYDYPDNEISDDGIGLKEILTKALSRYEEKPKD